MGVWKKLIEWFSTLDTSDARKGVADDLRKMSKVLFGLLVVNAPGMPDTLLGWAAKYFELPTEPLHVSVFTLVLLGVASFLLRALAFLFECSIKHEEKKALPKAKKKKATADLTNGE
ncbi:hypothetical protein F6X40_09570 [Paraburkholderia sp. UCT31]|uniref:hypothetical protein n=1 Tax=Paraburkholderia sp. UCT31 TaxID=2615209 RepID=UPI001656655B|nr:hypothetical protein [Paraburkholderia sp. UCT31]MBC8737057.1 hypothetical protein [Paraburkholderia sp. UCT31]